MRIKRITSADAASVIVGVGVTTAGVGGNNTGVAGGCYENNVTRTTALAAINVVGALAITLKTELNNLIAAAQRLGIQGLALVTAADATTAISGNNANAGANEGGFNDATARDLAITRMDAMVTLANEIGAINDRVIVSLEQSGALTGYRARALNVSQAIATALPAGGTGANTGGFLNLATRDTAITAINSIGTLLNDVKTKAMALEIKLQNSGIMG
jgi:hypothetical protein